MDKFAKVSADINLFCMGIIFGILMAIIANYYHGFYTRDVFIEKLLFNGMSWCVIGLARLWIK